MKKKTQTEFLNEVNKNNSKVKVLGSYVNYNTKVKVECLRCGYRWLAWPESVLKGRGCSKCAHNQKRTTNDFVLEMKDYNPFIEVVGDYISANKSIKVRCTICGNEWETTPARLLCGAQCMNCVKPHTSFMEQFLLIALQDILGRDDVISRDMTAIGLELDIFIPKYKLAIEPGSWLYHRKKADGIDSEKRLLCKKKGIRLITIYDTYPKNEEAPFKEDCFVFDGFLNEAGYKRIRNLLLCILSGVGIDGVEIDCKNIAERAYEACHYNANENFITRMHEAYPNIEVLEQYKGSNIPIRVNNRECNHPAWKARPYTLLKGIGCPLCARENNAQNRTKTQKEFELEVAKYNPNIKIIGKYKKITDRIEVKCTKCGYIWKPFGYSLNQGKGCPHCSALEGAKKRKGPLAVKTTKQFVMEMKAITDSLEILGEYKNNKTKIRTRCMQCGYEWDVVAASLLNGHGCPKCSRKNRKKRK